MKKALTILLVVMCAFMVFANGSKEDTAKASAPKQKQFLNMVTGGTSGTYYAFGADISNMLSKAVDGLEVTAAIGNGSVSNLREINSGDADLAFSQNDVATYAYTGSKPEKIEKITSFGVIANLYPEVVQSAYCDSTGIKSIADYKGRNISIGAAGSGVYSSVIDFLTANNMSLDDIKGQYLSFSESADALKNGQIDAAFVTAGIPNPAIQDLASTRDIELLNLSDAAVAKLCADNPYVPYTIKAGTYQGQSKDAKTVAVTALLVASNKLSEDTVYDITKALFESGSLLTHAKAAEVTLDTALQGFDVSWLHPGAAKYYREKGLIK